MIIFCRIPKSLNLKLLHIIIYIYIFHLILFTKELSVDSSLIEYVLCVFFFFFFSKLGIVDSFLVPLSRSRTRRLNINSPRTEREIENVSMYFLTLHRYPQE